MSTENNSSFRNGKQFAWDATSLSLAETCLRKYELVMIQGYAPTETSVHLLFGAIYASSLEQFFKLRSKEYSFGAARDAVVKLAMIASWDKENARPHNLTDKNKSRFSLIRSIVDYLDEFGRPGEADFPTLILEDGSPAVEYSFSYTPFPDEEGFSEIVFCGHLDRVVEYSPTDAFILDQKTTGGNFWSGYWKGFHPNTQVSMYTLAGNIVFNRNISGMMIDAISITPLGSNFERHLIPVDKAFLHEWMIGAKFLIETVHRAADANFYPMNPSSCSKYSGCEFQPVCTASPNLRARILREDFAPKKWDPLERR